MKIIIVIVEKKIALNDRSHGMDISIITAVIFTEYLKKKEKLTPLTMKKQIFKTFKKLLFFNG